MKKQIQKHLIVDVIGAFGMSALGFAYIKKKGNDFFHVIKLKN